MEVVGNKGWGCASKLRNARSQNWRHGIVSFKGPQGRTIPAMAFTLVYWTCFQTFGLQNDEIIDFCGFKAFGL